MKLKYRLVLSSFSTTANIKHYYFTNNRLPLIRRIRENSRGIDFWNWRKRIFSTIQNFRTGIKIEQL